jgi:small conductance mechanosensitive channel
MNQIGNYIENLKNIVLNYLPSFIMAIVVLVVGWWLIGKVGKMISAGMKNLDGSLKFFLKSIFTSLLKVLLLISVASMVGIQTTSFIAILGAAGLAVGLALQGTLANFAGGVLILIFKPYSIGDAIEALGKTGVVKEIQIFSTILNTQKGETIILPNGAVSNGTIVNHTLRGRVLVEIQVELAGMINMEEIRKLILPAIMADERILKDPLPVIEILGLKPGIVVVVFRAFTHPENLGPVYGNMIETIYTELGKNKISGPIPLPLIPMLA